jgi:hypothetical protein
VERRESDWSVRWSPDANILRVLACDETMRFPKWFKMIWYVPVAPTRRVERSSGRSSGFRKDLKIGADLGRQLVVLLRSEVAAKLVARLGDVPWSGLEANHGEATCSDGAS